MYMALGSSCVAYHECPGAGVELREQNLLIQRLGRTGQLHEARKLFDQLKSPNVFSWTMIMTACNENDDSDAALEFFSRMLHVGIKPDSVVFLAAIRACSSACNLARGIATHEQVKESGLEAHEFLASSLISMYGNCRGLHYAKELFDLTPNENVVLWNALLTAYAQSGHHKLASITFWKMDMNGVKADEVTYLIMLETVQTMDEAERIHKRISLLGFESLVSDHLVSMYCRLGYPDKAAEVFRGTSNPKSLVSWTTLLTAHAQCGRAREAFKCLSGMDLEGIKPNQVTFIGLLAACECPKDVKTVLERILHEHHHLKTCTELRNSLIATLVEFSELEQAVKVFIDTPNRTIVTWNTMISGYTKYGFPNESMKLLNIMDYEGAAVPNSVTFLAVFEACQTLKLGQELYRRAIITGHGSDTTVANSAINMFSRYSSLEDAKIVFDGISHKTVVSWTSMIVAYVHTGNPGEALELYRRMKQQKISPDAVTFTHIFSICRGDEQFSELVSELVADCRMVVSEEKKLLSVMNSLINMYGKSGELDEAQEIFNRMCVRDVFSWTTLITAYAEKGHMLKTMELLSEMNMEGVTPENVTFLSLLHSCNHSGVVYRSRVCFQAMQPDYGVPPCAEHYRCMVDVLARSGKLNAAEDLLLSMPFEPDELAWRSFLSACRVHQSSALHAAKSLSISPSKTASPYVLLTHNLLQPVH